MGAGRLCGALVYIYSEHVMPWVQTYYIHTTWYDLSGVFNIMPVMI